MNGKFLTIGLILLLGLFPGKLISQEPEKQTIHIENVQQAIEMALENHPSVKAGQLRVEQQQKLKKAAWDLPDAKLSYEKEHNEARMEAWSVEQGMKNPLEHLAKNKLARQRIAQSKRLLEKKKAALKREVRSAYISVLYAKEKVSLFDRLQHIFSNLSRAGKLRYETGDVSYLEKVSARAKYKEIRVAREEALNLLAGNKNTLRNTLFVSDSLTLRDCTLKKLEPGRGYAGADSVASNPDVELYRQKWETQQAQSKAAQSQSWPDPFFRYSRRDFDGNGSFSAFELGIRIPIDTWAEKGRNQAAKLAAREAFQNYREMENDRITTYQNTLENLETYSRQLEYFEESRLKEAKMIIKSASKQYRAGNIDYVQYINYFDQATRIRLNYLDILKTYNLNIIELEYLLGK